MGVSICCGKSSKAVQDLNANIQSTEGYGPNQDLDLYYNEFKMFLIGDLFNSLPFSSTQFQHKFMTEIETIQKRMLNELISIRKNSGEIRKTLNFFGRKCKALEGYLRYINDFKSIENLKNVKIKLLKEFLDRNKDTQALIYQYYKEVRGSYELQGCKELKQIFSYRDAESMIELIEFQYSQGINNIKDLYKGLFEIEPIDQEIFELAKSQALF